MKKILLCCVCISLVLKAASQEVNTYITNDSTETKFGKKIDKLTTSRFYNMTYVGVPLVIGGLAVKSEDTHFRRLRNDYLPQFNRHLDDYMQFSPAAVMMGLKIAGVDGRSSWGRMLVSDALSAVIMGGVVNTLKHSTNVERPDGSNTHSFPSGHTATAFMTATMLNKEYGYKSPWIGIGAYAVASATGLMRMANNKHWLSDVLTGAGIGILSTEMGYYLADMIFKDKGLHHKDIMYYPTYKPSFVSLYLGINIPLSGYDIDNQTEFRTSSGSSAGVEGAYFLTPNLGIGGRFAASATSIIVNGQQASDQTFDAISFAGGGYISFPISSRWLVGGKLLGEYIHYPQIDLTDLSIPARGGMGFGSGLSVTFNAKLHYGMRFFLDYDLMPSHSKGSNEYMNKLTPGMAFMISL